MLRERNSFRDNHTPYITKTLRKSCVGTQLEKKYLKTKTQTDLKLYKKHKKKVLSYAKREEENAISPL